MRIEIWPGMISAIRCYEEQMLLCVDVAHKLLRTDSVLDFLLELYKTEGRERFKETATQELVGMSVMTRSVLRSSSFIPILLSSSIAFPLLFFSRYNNKMYRVDDILWDDNPLHEFEQSDGTRISLRDYYRNQYNRDVKDLEQPLLVSRAKRS
ncbi:MAG: hypothetical protein GY854_22200 [Deltaproteobacteria bacterium]|nr:hypothetical protein [Deltaproteobacteria bacterium]